LTARCAASIERGRPTLIGRMTPGNRTVSRTGRTMSASAGSSGSGCGALSPPCSLFNCIASALIEALLFVSIS
jgi:hypothetical protein